MHVVSLLDTWKSPRDLLPQWFIVHAIMDHEVCMVYVKLCPPPVCSCSWPAFNSVFFQKKWSSTGRVGSARLGRIEVVFSWMITLSCTCEMQIFLGYSELLLENLTRLLDSRCTPTFQKDFVCIRWDLLLILIFTVHAQQKPVIYIYIYIYVYIFSCSTSTSSLY